MFSQISINSIASFQGLFPSIRAVSAKPKPAMSHCLHQERYLLLLGPQGVGRLDPIDRLLRPTIFGNVFLQKIFQHLMV